MPSMTRRTLAQVVGANVAAAIAASGETTSSVSEAIDIPLDDLDDRLSGSASFDVAELVTVGGFLRIRASSLLEGAAA